MNKRNYTFDIARALSMLYIVGVFHLSNYTNAFSMLPLGEYLKNAALGLFMFLSAYLLSQKYPIHTLADTKKLFTRRIIRIIPLYSIALLLYVLRGTITIRTGVFAAIGLSSILPPQPPTLWFVSLLIVFYYLFPLLSGKKTASQILVTLLIIGIFGGIKIYFGGIDRRFFYYFPCFALGCMVSGIEFSRLFNLKTFVGALSVFIMLICINMEYALYIQRALLAISGSFIIIYTSSLLSKNKRIINFFIPISYASMAVYMFHRFFLVL